MMFQSWVLMILEARDEKRTALCTLLRARQQQQQRRRENETRKRR